MRVIWGKREAEYFWGEGWTGQIRLILFRKLVFWRNVVENAASVAPHEPTGRANARPMTGSAICGELDRAAAGCCRVHPGHVR
jgi:hypothetical protein